MSLYVSKGKVITELDPPVVTALQPKSVLVSVRTGKAQLAMGSISGNVVVLEAGEVFNVSTLAAPDFVEQMTVTAIGPGANVLVAWSHF